MPTDSALSPGLARVVPLRAMEMPPVRGARARLPHLSLRWRTAPRVDGMVGMAELGRETGVRC